MRCIALLRGINVGKARRIAMADLRSLVEGLGHRDVRTLLNSGNVVFDAARAASTGQRAVAIQSAIAQTLGVSAQVTVVTADELAAIVNSNPFADAAAQPSRFLVAFFAAAQAARKIAALGERDWAPERLALGARAAYLWCPGGILDSKLATAVMRLAGDAATTRNWATVRKLHAMASPSGQWAATSLR